MDSPSTSVRWGAVLALAWAGCTSDNPAPDCYAAGCRITAADATGSGGSGSEGGTTSSEPPSVACGEVPPGAVGAAYEHAFERSGDLEGVTLAVDGLPEGLQLDPASGTLAGQPETSGTFDLQVRLVGQEVGEAITCPLTIRPALTVDLEAVLAAPLGCLTGDASLLDHVVAETGDDSPITCAHASGRGSGELPAGIDVDPDSCTLVGTLEASRPGTYVFIVRGSQSGRAVFVPYCVTQPEMSEDAYTVEASHSGSDDAALLPIVRRYTPGEPFAVGEPGAPEFRVVDRDICSDAACFYGFAYAIHSSLFDDTTFSLEPDRLLEDEDGTPVGFSHTLRVEGPAPSLDSETWADYAERPWVLNVALDYCLATSRETCSGTAATRENGRGGLEVGILMVPEPE